MNEEIHCNTNEEKTNEWQKLYKVYTKNSFPYLLVNLFRE